MFLSIQLFFIKTLQVGKLYSLYKEINLMKQREVTDSNNVRWTCVQAYSGTDGNVSKKVEEMSETDEGLVPVVCTPTGGAQSVRLNLSKDWESMSDEALIQGIEQAS